MSFDGAKLKSRLQYINASDTASLLGLYYGEQSEIFSQLNEIENPSNKYQTKLITKYSYYTPLSFTDEHFHYYSNINETEATKAGVEWESCVFEASLQNPNFPQEFKKDNYIIKRNTKSFIKDGFSSTPDGIILDKDNKIVCVIEIKTVAKDNLDNNINQQRYKIQNIVQMKTTGADQGIIFVMARNSKNKIIPNKTILIKQNIKDEYCQSILNILPILQQDIEADKQKATTEGFQQEFVQDDRGYDFEICSKDNKIDQTLKEAYLNDKDIEKWYELKNNNDDYNKLNKRIGIIASFMPSGECKIYNSYKLISKARVKYETEESIQAEIEEKRLEIERLQLKIRDKDYEVGKPSKHFEIEKLPF
jgi:hypothetical protein